jgi:hypothetical protein
VFISDPTNLQESDMTTADEGRERDFLAKCIADAYQMLEIIPGVNPNGAALVWLADQFMQVRRRTESQLASTP